MKEVFKCECQDDTHTFSVSHDGEAWPYTQVFVDITLTEQKTFLGRLSAATRYVFGLGRNTTASAEVVLGKAEIAHLRDTFTRIIIAAKKEQKKDQLAASKTPKDKS